MNKMTTVLREYLRTGKHLTPKLYRKFVTILVDDLFEKDPRPVRKELIIVCREICKSYTSVQDTVCGEKIGCGYATLLKKMSYKIENELRCVNASRRQLVKGRKRNVNELDTHACANFWPKIINDDEDKIQAEMKKSSVENVKYPQELMSSTYNSQRKDIVSGDKNILELQDTWPYLFHYEGMVAHYNELNACDLEQSIHDSIEKKIGPFTKFLGQQKSCVSLYEDILVQTGSDGNQSCHLIGMILMVMAEFKEDADILFAIPQVSISHIHDLYLYWV